MQTIIELSERQRKLIDIIQRTRQLRDEIIIYLASQRDDVENHQTLQKSYPDSKKLPTQIAFFKEQITTEVELLNRIQTILTGYEKMLKNVDDKIKALSQGLSTPSLRAMEV